MLNCVILNAADIAKALTMDQARSMGAVSDFEHLSRAAQMLPAYVAKVHAQCIANLQVGACTVDVNGLRTCTMSTTIIAVGLIGTFEGMLQRRFLWADAYNELDKVLRDKGRDDLADRLLDYRLATNVLKHGVGRSYDKLLARRNVLPFPIKGREEAFFMEFDISELDGLIDTRGPFVENCIEIIDEIRAVIGLSG